MSKSNNTVNNDQEYRSGSLLDSNSEDIRSGRIKVAKKQPVRQASRAKDQKKKKRTIYILAVVAVSILLACILIPSMLLTINEMLVYELKIEETDITYHEDGIYRARYESSHMSAVVSVNIVSGKMISISLEDFTGIDPARAKEVFECVIFYQMLNIPSEDPAEVFSQTTDFVVLKAIEAALNSEPTGEVYL